MLAETVVGLAVDVGFVYTARAVGERIAVNWASVKLAGVEMVIGTATADNAFLVLVALGASQVMLLDGLASLRAYPTVHEPC